MKKRTPLLHPLPVEGVARGWRDGCAVCLPVEKNLASRCPARSPTTQAPPPVKATSLQLPLLIRHIRSISSRDFVIAASERRARIDERYLLRNFGSQGGGPSHKAGRRHRILLRQNALDFGSK